MSALKHIGGVMAGMGNPQERGAPDPYAGGLMTKHGWFSYDDITRAGGRLDYDANGTQVIRFPTWDKERGRHFREVPEWKVREGER